MPNKHQGVSLAFLKSPGSTADKVLIMVNCVLQLHVVVHYILLEPIASLVSLCMPTTSGTTEARIHHHPS